MVKTTSNKTFKLGGTLMKYYDKSKISKGKRFSNIVIAIFSFLLLLSLIESILSKELIKLKDDIIFPTIYLIVITLYYKGNKVVFKIISSIVPCLFVIPVFYIFNLSITFLTPLGILDIWGGTLFLIMLIAYIGIGYLLFRKIGWFECIEEYRTYRIENGKDK